MTIDAKARARFEAKLMPIPYAGCHLWTACTHPGGYGSFKLAGQALKAHRVAYEIAHGPIPNGLHVLHRCDVRSCCNPDHLFLGTRADNMADMVAKGRQSRKLTDSDVREIRARYAAGGISQEALAEAYGVGQVAISKRVRAA